MLCYLRKPRLFVTEKNITCERPRGSRKNQAKMSIFGSSLIVIIRVCDLPHMNHDKDLPIKPHYLFSPETQTAFVTKEKGKGLKFCFLLVTCDISSHWDCGYKSFILCAFLFFEWWTESAQKTITLHAIGLDTRQLSDTWVYFWDQTPPGSKTHSP